MNSNNNWQPRATLSTLQQRSRLLAHIRHYFAEQQVLEVETPILAPAGNTDPMIENIQARFSPLVAAGDGLYLQTSPEYAMKRLLAAGSGPIYQICKVFRAGERGRRHNPEFSMLEWYRPGYNLQQLMDEVEELVSRVAQIEGEAWRCTYRQLFQRFLAVDPVDDEIFVLQSCAQRHGIVLDGVAEDRDFWLDLLLSHIIEPQLCELGRMVFVYEFPSSQAALARLDSHGMAERFELYLDGLELANGYHELADAGEQRRRFERDNERRYAAGKAKIPIDEALLMALQSGLPDCSGVALGLDRLLMCCSGIHDIAQVLAFPLEI